MFSSGFQRFPAATARHMRTNTSLGPRFRWDADLAISRASSIDYFYSIVHTEVIFLSKLEFGHIMSRHLSLKPFKAVPSKRNLPALDVILNIPVAILKQ